jgi:hypothetical protein
LAFDSLLKVVAELKDVEIGATKNCVVFVKNKTFLVAKPMIKFLEIKFDTNEHIEQMPSLEQQI